MRNRVADEIGAAAREIGLFQIYDHGIDPSLIEDTYRAAQTFFSQPEAFKQRYYIGLSTNHRGYVPFTERGDYEDEANRSYEAFDLGLDLPPDDADYQAGSRLLGPNVWPDLAGFKEAVARYYKRISHVGQLLCTAFEHHLGLPPATLTGHMTKPISQLRLLHYVRHENAVDRTSVNMGAHTDYECLTLLHTRNAGLQAMTRDDRWVDVPTDPTTFVVNVGDMLEAWSNGLFRSTPHRVLNLSAERFSLPYFVATNQDTVIAPFPALITDTRPARYDAFRAGDHLERMLRRDFVYLKEQPAPPVPADAKAGPGEIRNPFETRLHEVSGR